MSKIFKNYINGKWKASGSGETFDAIDVCADTTGLVAGKKYKCVLTVKDTSHPCPDSDDAKVIKTIIVKVKK